MVLENMGGGYSLRLGFSLTFVLWQTGPAALAGNKIMQTLFYFLSSVLAHSPAEELAVSVE